MNATPWSLDEFASHDMFMSSTPESADHRQEAGVDVNTIEANFELRLTAERARIEADAYARGRADGERSARSTTEQSLQGALGALYQAAQSVAMHEGRWLNNLEENIAALAVSVARHVLQREIVADPTLVADLVASALAQYAVDQEITIRLNPDDLTLCRQVIETDNNGARTMRWIGDVSIAHGGCLTEGRERIIDGRVDTALERVYRTLAQVHAS